MSSQAATGEPGLEARALNPGGGSKTQSRWLIQHCWVSGRPDINRPPSSTSDSSVRPNSPRSAPSTRPPRARTMTCIP